ncbi:MAG: NRDE family protein [Smithellaceae bacterium]|nr:NRDE family protein [Smithellaceae bacterium]
MCLILFSYRCHPSYPLILAANRDEFYDRPAEGISFWKESPEMVAGRDLKEGGTWLGMTRGGRLAALTNYRDPASLRADAPSRGLLVRDFLQSRESVDSYLGRLTPAASAYNGFSLLGGDGESLYYFSNRGGAKRRLAPGVYGLSNHLLDTSWPKVEKGKKSLVMILAGQGGPAIDDLFAILSDQARPADAALPDTGVGLEWERILSPLFIVSPLYGTRSSTVLTIDAKGVASIVERVFTPGSNSFQETTFHFPVEGW